MSYIEWKSQGILKVSEPRDRKKTVEGDTELCQKCYLILKDVQLPKTPPPEGHYLSIGSWKEENSKVLTATKKL